MANPQKAHDVKGLILSAPSSRSGKTTLTLGILRALHRRGIAIRAAKSGPDYIDPRFHEAACAQPCFNLDAWAMTPDRISAIAQGDIPMLIEGAMGLFDGAPPDGKGATADLARILQLPVVMVIDASSMAQSVAAILRGFRDHDPLINIAGVILNKVGSPRHEKMLRHALAPLDIPVLGAIPRSAAISQPSRHLGLVQAQERPDLDQYLDASADLIEASLDLDQLVTLMTPMPVATPARKCPPFAQRIAIAQDAAFAFAYPHLMQDWRDQGAEITLFSPLADQPIPVCDFVYLPGGYPELHAGQIASSHSFLASLRNAAQSIDVYGECGGYMVLGDGLIDADGTRHKMAGLLRLETSFATRKLHLGYRDLTPLAGPFTAPCKAHEFHYSTELKAMGDPLFAARDAMGDALPNMGLRQGRVSGSYAHVIDMA